MEKLTKQQESGICKLLHHTHNKNVVQHILNTIGRNNWTRDILMECKYEYLTKEQKELYESLGGGYSSEEMDEYIESLSINEEIVEQLKEQGVTKFLYENEEYIEDIREGRIICEGINVDKIKKSIWG
ncbi:MAG: hypothetical protein ACI31A_08360 [Candidatus Limisoma sp.]